MSIIIRKITKKTILSFIGLSGLALALIGRFIPWEPRVSLSQLEAKARNITLESGFVDIANADTPSTSSSSSSSEGSGGSAGGDCDEGACT
jgi:hypothetical protein